MRVRALKDYYPLLSSPVPSYAAKNIQYKVINYEEAGGKESLKNYLMSMAKKVGTLFA